jgi:hypothetical protein
MMATTMNAATSDSMRSNAFDLGAAAVSGGGMALRRRCEFAVKPTAHAGFHGVARYDERVNATALLALERAVIGAGWPRFNLRENHAGLLALRATLSDTGRAYRRYRLILWHDVSAGSGGSVTELTVTENCLCRAVIRQSHTSGSRLTGQNCSHWQKLPNGSYASRQ